MTIYNIKVSNLNREDVIKYIRDCKSKRTFKVIDVGASANSWSASIIDAIVDINPDSFSNPDIIRFKGDINKDDVWRDVKNWVNENGKFDFCICTHTLEDIRDPLFVCKQMNTIASSGYIAIPSKYKELYRFESGTSGYRGYIHHRWIFTIENGNFIGYPKLSVIEHMLELDKIASNDDNKADLSFYWKDKLDLTLYNNDYMGPNPGAVVSYLARLLYHNEFSNSFQ